MSKFDQRAQILMKTLVETYISSGQPVGSKTLLENSQLSVSPATVRNVMQDLESMGLLTAPYTSAGRIPTSQGVRLFVDQLLTVSDVEDIYLKQLQKHLGSISETGEMLSGVSNMLSQVTRMAGLIRVPRRDVTCVKQVQFVPLTQNKVLVVLVLSDGEVQNRVIQLDSDVSRAELEQATNYVNHHFAGKELDTVRRELLQELKDDRETMDQMMASMMKVAEKGFAANDDEIQVTGKSQLLNYANTGDISDLQSVFEAFAEKTQMLTLLDKCLSADGVQLFIGEESGYDVLSQCSVVGAPYSVDGQAVGVLAVVGPTRMAYDKVIPMVDITAKLISAALNNEE
ncbi:heat-inducible transcriptional repressor HrcA [Kangiella sediminilitoris]|uniref:Heat-inducible transcription repressor HrcA n=1 Tax=Kangiella sediminilitoris TaxID=1144748 RepID=A0A1B3B834_9GAMM|nr:heat-inducible transcriptional repressor HrcA [Kangiella sediminilitoris]AOE48947.1 HrcA family transcriptional regulator [Kangiella sediminilitoris]